MATKESLGAHLCKEGGDGIPTWRDEKTCVVSHAITCTVMQNNYRRQRGTRQEHHKALRSSRQNGAFREGLSPFTCR